MLLTAAWLVPMSGPPIRDGAVVFENGRIIAVGTAKHLRNLHPNSEIHDSGAAVIFPGLINAHTHLELSDCKCGPPPKQGFAGWLVGMLQRTRITPEEMDQAVKHAIAVGVTQCHRFGVTTVGDISRQCRLTRSLLKDQPLRVVSYGEVQAMAQRRGLLEERVATAADESTAGPMLRIGITPHAPYSIEPDGYRRCLQIAQTHHLPLATHLAETPDEDPFLAEHRGPLRDLWTAWLTWDNSVPTFRGGPIRYAKSLGLLDYPTLLAHVNYCDDDELTILAAGKASVVYTREPTPIFPIPPSLARDAGCGNQRRDRHRQLCQLPRSESGRRDSPVAQDRSGRDAANAVGTHNGPRGRCHQRSNGCWIIAAREIRRCRRLSSYWRRSPKRYSGNRDGTN